MNDLLSHELFTVREAARLLHIERRKVWRWLDGGEVSGTRYEPVIRRESSGVDIVTWGEFVELACLAEYRAANVHLGHLRPAISRLRERFAVEYPLANLRPLVAGRDLVMGIQDEVDLPAGLRLVERAADGQLGFALGFELFRIKVDWADSGDQPALRFFPAGRESHVVIDPGLSFGSATVRGIRTDVLAELVAAGEPIDQVLDWYDLELSLLRDALRFERVPSERLEDVANEEVSGG